MLLNIVAVAYGSNKSVPAVSVWISSSVCVFPGGLDSVEYYDIASNEWRAASAMPWRGVTVKCAAVGDVIYVLAGFQGVGRLGHVLEYHTDTDRSAY